MKEERDKDREGLLDLQAFPAEPMKTMRERRDAKLLETLPPARVIDLTCPKIRVACTFPEKVLLEQKGKKKKKT